MSADIAEERGRREKDRQKRQITYKDTNERQLLSSIRENKRQ